MHNFSCNLLKNVHVQYTLITLYMYMRNTVFVHMTIKARSYCNILYNFKSDGIHFFWTILIMLQYLCNKSFRAFTLTVLHVFDKPNWASTTKTPNITYKNSKKFCNTVSLKLEERSEGLVYRKCSNDSHFYCLKLV